jgi:hypothetical protein
MLHLNRFLLYLLDTIQNDCLQGREKDVANFHVCEPQRGKALGECQTPYA